jgi:hypothetical protein
MRSATLGHGTRDVASSPWFRRTSGCGRSSGNGGATVTLRIYALRHDLAGTIAVGVFIQGCQQIRHPSAVDRLAGHRDECRSRVARDGIEPSTFRFSDGFTMSAGVRSCPLGGHDLRFLSLEVR